MIKFNILYLLLAILTIDLSGAEIIGTVKDETTGELLFGTNVYIEELQIGTITGLDGSFCIKNIKPGTYTLTCSFISYETQRKTIVLGTEEKYRIDFSLQTVSTQISQVTVVANAGRSTENTARVTERNAMSITNVVSARAIELSPDITMSGVVQRMSGVILDKSTSSSGEYAILRGMDKRYNYTLINGIKIPSTNNKHRYISLDLFPADMVDRVEVTKALTPDLEGDAIAGVINLMMKNAPEQQLLQFNVSAGYNSFNLNHSFERFHTTDIQKESPFERNVSGYNAKVADFSTNNLDPYQVNIPLDYTGNLSYGNRFLHNRLGMLVSGSYSQMNRGKSSLLFVTQTTKDGYNLPELTSMQTRTYTETGSNLGIHTKLDYRVNPNHKLEFYGFLINMQEKQVRQSDILDLDVNYEPTEGTYLLNHSTRTRWNIQEILNTTLQGKHILTEKFSGEWSLVYSKASNQTPDQATIKYSENYTDYNPEPSYLDFDGSERLWRHNSEQDLAAYLNFKYKTNLKGLPVSWKVGGLYRHKERESFKTSYTLLGLSTTRSSDSIYYSEKGVDWDNYRDISWKVYNPRGATANGETYHAYEDVSAGYIMFQSDYQSWNFTGGIRVEHTEQGYSMQYPIGQTYPNGSQNYTDFLPGLHIKYVYKQKHNFRASYYRAINKPGFLEIVPCPVVEEDYTTQGNHGLKRAIADNIDVRWEFFPKASDQVMIGLFYKQLHDPIEYAFTTISSSSQKVTYSPVNSGEAENAGIEVDVIKYFRQVGVKANYTFTHSAITTEKLSYERDANGDILPNYDAHQTRPLFGQAQHVGNLSLIYKGSNNGMNAQLSFTYTGERLYTISQVINNDLWQEPQLLLSFSAEKTFQNGWALYFKAKDLLTDSQNVFIKKVNSTNEEYPMHSSTDKNTMVRREQVYSSFLIGFRYRLK